MNDSDPPALDSFDNYKLCIMKEGPAFCKVLSWKASGMQRIIQMVLWAAQKSCRRAGQLFCCPMDTVIHEKVTCCPALNGHSAEVKDKQVAKWGSPSTVLIVNISNSTLIDCVIGNDTYTSLLAECQPLMQKSELNHDLARCSCSCRQQGAAQTSLPPSSAESASVNILSSHLNCVIIGDNNYMHAEQGDSAETEELTGCGHTDQYEVKQF